MLPHFACEQTEAQGILLTISVRSRVAIKWKARAPLPSPLPPASGSPLRSQVAPALNPCWSWRSILQRRAGRSTAVKGRAQARAGAPSAPLALWK